MMGIGIEENERKRKRGTMKNTKQYEQEYWHIRKISLLPFIATLFFSWLAWINLKLIDWNIIKIAFNCEKDSCSLISRDLIVCYILIFECLFICIAIISLVAMFKGGFDKLKRYDDEGLISSLIFGLISGLISGLIFGLIFGLISSLTFGLGSLSD